MLDSSQLFYFFLLKQVDNPAKLTDTLIRVNDFIKDHNFFFYRCHCFSYQMKDFWLH